MGTEVGKNVHILQTGVTNGASYSLHFVRHGN